MCEEYKPPLFCTLSIFMAVFLFGLTLTNMIFAILTPINDNTFIHANYSNNYNELNYFSFLIELNFGSQLEFKNDYAIMGPIKTLCYYGMCHLDSHNTISKNCSEACLTSAKYCYDDDDKTKRCNYKTCFEGEKWESFTVCHEFNKAQSWRNTEYCKYAKEYKVLPYEHIITKDQNCPYGYKKCGIVNEQKDYLCLKIDKEFGCPINDIIVKSNNDTIEEGYRSFKLGDKYLFISHDKTDNYIIKNLTVSLDIFKRSSDLKEVDNETFDDFHRYNYISLDEDSEQPSFAYLDAIQFKLNYTHEDIEKDKELINKKKEIYTTEKLKEMNLEIIQYKLLLFGFGIALFSTVGVYSLCIYTCYCFDSEKDPECRECCCLCIPDFTPIKYIIQFYMISIPIIVMLIFVFVLTVIKKINYNKISSMEYVEEYKNLTKYKFTSYGSVSEVMTYDYFGKSIIYNNVQFILLLILLILIIIYPITIILIYRPPKPKKQVKKNENDDEDEDDVCRHSLNAELSTKYSKPTNGENVTES